MKGGAVTVQQENVMKQIDDTIIHKKLVMDACYKLAKYLFQVHRDDDAFVLLKRAQVHDNSKLCKDELESLQKIVGTNDGMTNPEYKMTCDDKKCIELHWKNNRHHPEHFEDVRDMSEIDIMEMVCDWYARSIQYKTDFIHFVITRQENRFHFPDDMFNKILVYCDILLQES